MSVTPAKLREDDAQPCSLWIRQTCGSVLKYNMNLYTYQRARVGVGNYLLSLNNVFKPQEGAVQSQDSLLQCCSVVGLTALVWMYMDSLRAVKAQQAQNRAGIKDKTLIKSNTMCKRESQVEKGCISNCRQAATISITEPIFDLPFGCVKGDISCGISWCVLALKSAAVTGILGWV